jgi:hypothetical protein
MELHVAGFADQAFCSCIFQGQLKYVLRYVTGADFNVVSARMTI